MAQYTPASSIKPVITLAEGEGGGYLGTNWVKNKVSLDEFEDILIKLVDDYVSVHPQGILTASNPADRESLADTSAVEASAVQYLTNLLRENAKKEDRIGYYQALDDSVSQHEITINWGDFLDPTGKETISDVGTFFEDKIFGLREETGLAQNDPRPDILAMLADIKTNAEDFGRNFKIEVANITTEGINVIPNQYIYSPQSELTPDEEKLQKILSNNDLLLKIALYKLVFKMASFVYIKMDKKREGKEATTRVHILAFIYFYRLLIHKLEEHFLRGTLAEGRITAELSSSKFKRKVYGDRYEYVRNISVQIEKSFSPNLQGIARMAEELKFLRDIYAKEYPLIDNIKRLSGKRAITFYSQIYNQDLMELELGPVNPE